MSFKLGLGLALALFSLTFSVHSFAQQEKLIFAVDVIRHGDRTPIHDLPGTPYNWPQGLGQLTPTGMQQEFKLGMAMRKRYIEDTQLLPSQYSAKTLYVRSSDYDRTLMSAESLLFGLYPLGTGPLLPETDTAALPSAYQPIPIHTVPQKDDTLLVIDSQNHQHYEALLQQYVYSQPDWKKKTAELQPQFAHWSQLTGVKITQLSQLISLGDTLFIRQLYHLPLPTGMTETDERAILEAHHWAFSAIFKTPALRQFGQPLLAVIAAYFKQASQHQNKLKFVLFSGHDTTIMSLMSAMEAPLETPPPYASDLSFAVFETATGETLVKLSLNGNPLRIPACQGTICTLSQFEALIN